MTTLAAFVVFSTLPLVALTLAIGYSLVSIRRLDDLRPLVLVTLLAFMATHQLTELAAFTQGELVVNYGGELTETSANLLASFASYFLLDFVREEHRLNERLRTQRRELRRTRRAIEASGHAVCISDADGRIDYVNPAFEEMTGYSADEVRGEHPDILVTDGTVEYGDNEHVLRRKDGERYYVQQTSAPITDEDGNYEGFVSIQTDITDRKRLENDLRESLRQLQVFDRILRHNFHNGINVIKGYAETIQSSSDGDVADYASIVVDRSETLLHTVDKEHEITKRLANPKSPEPLELAPLLDAAVSAVEEADHGADITVTQPRDVRVKATTDVRRAVEELVTNAVIHSDRESPTVTVDVTIEGDEVAVSVADDGPGIPEMERKILTSEREIEPLYHGSGIGLWLVTLIVRQLDGSLSFHENDPRGCVVTVRLPLAD
ncbi:PAS domain S-box protein [Haloplanus aerogenes]|nr:PAS domain-containing sensor histidine kinase [Haloplanus aerogenes]RMB13293.1 PAS domain S-box-containing protein [Haloplanus aerogenes]